MAGETEQTGVIFLAEKLEARGIFEGMDGVLLGETDCVWTFERVQVCEEGVGEGGTGRAFEEEGCFGVFGFQGGALGKGAGRPRGFGFACLEN